VKRTVREQGGTINKWLPDEQHIASIEAKRFCGSCIGANHRKIRGEQIKSRLCIFFSPGVGLAVGDEAGAADPADGAYSETHGAKARESDQSQAF